jgi:hypothetical protein
MERHLCEHHSPSSSDLLKKTIILYNSFTQTWFNQDIHKEKTMKKTTIWIDLIAFAGFLLAFMPDLTGYQWHEWLGLAIGGVLLIHLLQHTQWVKGAVQCFARKKWKVLGKFLLDAALGLSFFTIIVSGVVISSLLMLPLSRYETWRLIHVIASYATLAVLGLKIALHWDWLKRAVQKWLEPAGEKAPVLASRRKFLRTCGITGLALVVAVAEWKEWQSKVQAGAPAPVSDEPQPQSENLLPALLAAEPTPEPSATPTPLDLMTEQDKQANAHTAAPTATSQPEATVSSLPTITETPAEGGVVLTGVVRCARGCAYPGKCRKYQDTITANGKCDLGEPIW